MTRKYHCHDELSPRDLKNKEKSHLRFLISLCNRVELLSKVPIIQMFVKILTRGFSRQWNIIQERRIARPFSSKERATEIHVALRGNQKLTQHQQC